MRGESRSVVLYHFRNPAFLISPDEPFHSVYVEEVRGMSGHYHLNSALRDFGYVFREPSLRDWMQVGFRFFDTEDERF